MLATHAPPSDAGISVPFMSITVITLGGSPSVRPFARSLLARKDHTHDVLITVKTYFGAQLEGLLNGLQNTLGSRLYP